MNKAICEFAIGSCRKVDEFRQEFKKLCSDKSKLNLEELDALDSEQHCVIFFNYAIVLYNLKQYSQCLRIVEKIYSQFNEALDEKFSRQVSLMLINLYIEMRLVSTSSNRIVIVCAAFPWMSVSIPRPHRTATVPTVSHSEDNAFEVQLRYGYGRTKARNRSSLRAKSQCFFVLVC